MRASEFLIKTKRENEIDVSPSYLYTQKSGMIHQTSAGIYTFSPLGYKVINKITNIIRTEMDSAGALEISMPTLQTSDLWIKSGRWGIYGDEMFKLSNREKREFCLGPTHEEPVCDFAKSFIDSYKDLPINVYQIGKKFRDELRPRQGLLRCREFLMKDAYSFDVDEKSCDISYQKMRDTYLKIFDKVGLDILCISADTGEMGGASSEEIIAPSEWGEDKFNFKNGVYQKLEGETQENFQRGIEVGHIFKLGSRYSDKLGVTFNNSDGHKINCKMGCYGIGISRLVSSIIEQNHDEKGIKWPKHVSPFDVEIIALGASPSVTKKSDEVYNFLRASGRDVLLDDREKSPGVKFKDADLIGIPHKFIVGDRSLSQGLIEYENRIECRKQKLKIDDEAILQIMGN